MNLEINSRRTFFWFLMTALLWTTSISKMYLKSCDWNVIYNKLKFQKVDFSHNYYDDDRSSTCSKSEKKEYHIPKNEKIKIIDFGGATYAHEHHSSVINTRQYRAPEIILCLSDC